MRPRPHRDCPGRCAVDDGIAVEYLAPAACARYAKPVVRPGHRRKIAYHQDATPAAVLAQKSDDARLRIALINPLEPFRREVELVQRGRCPIDAVQVAHPALYAGVQRKMQHVPLEALVVLPLALLTELPAHEQQLLAGVPPHIAIQQTQIRELLPFIAGHLADQRALAVHDLVVGERQHEVLAEGIPEREGEGAVLVGSVQGVGTKILQRVVHPAHVSI